jgi:hypothetical protein
MTNGNSRWVKLAVLVPLSGLGILSSALAAQQAAVPAARPVDPVMEAQTTRPVAPSPPPGRSSRSRPTIVPKSSCRARPLT